MVGLYLFNALLLTRVFLLFRDETVFARHVAVVWALQMAMLLPLAWSAALALLALALSVVNVAWLWAEARFPARLYEVRLLALAALFLSVGCFVSPAVGLEFRASLPPMLAHAGAYFAPLPLAGTLEARSAGIYLLGILLCVSEANLVVRIVIERFSLKPKDPQPAPGAAKPEAEIGYKRGRVIGLLERLILFYLVLGGQFGALGFVIAAKTMARFKNLEDRDFAEYFLVGTLLSLMAAGSVALLIRWLLGPTSGS